MKFTTIAVSAALALVFEVRADMVDVKILETVYLDLSPSTKLMGASTTGTNSWKVTKKAGRMAGIMVDVDGAGSYAKLDGTMSTSTNSLDKSTAYASMRNQYRFGGGVASFWNWMVRSKKTNYQKEQIKAAFSQISKQMKSQATVKVDLYVTGSTPNVEVQAGAYVVALEIEDSAGNKYIALSNSGASDDVYGGNTNNSGAKLPENDNNSTITFN